MSGDEIDYEHASLSTSTGIAVIDRSGTLMNTHRPMVLANGAT